MLKTLRLNSLHARHLYEELLTVAEPMGLTRNKVRFCYSQDPQSIKKNKLSICFAHSVS